MEMWKSDIEKQTGGGTMKALLFKKIVSLSLIISLLFTFFVGLSKLFEKINSGKEVLELTVNQIAEGVMIQQEAEEKAKEIFIHDYLNRAHFAEEFIHNDQANDSDENDWDYILKLTEVDNVYVINQNGVVYDSSETSAIGLNILKGEKMSAFWPLIEGTQDMDYHIEFNMASMMDQQEKIFLMLKSYQNTFIQLEIDPNVLLQYLEAGSLDSYVSKIPTNQNCTIFVLDMEAGDVITKTKSHQYIQEENLMEESLKAMNEAKVIKMKGEYQILYAQTVNNKYIVGETLVIKSFLPSLWLNVAMFYAISCIFLIAIIGCNMIFFDRYVIRDLMSIVNNMKKFIAGYFVTFKPAQTKELNYLSSILNTFIDHISESQQKITTMAEMLGKGYGGYEYFSDLNKLYYSSNILELVEMNEQEFEESVKRYFEKHSQNIETNVTIENIWETKSGKVLKCHTVITSINAYSFITDITKERHEKRKLLLQLMKEKQQATTDSLTGLTNRQGILDYYQSLQQETSDVKGIIVLFDLDNFKAINDNFGHLVGDDILIQFGLMLKKQFKDKDLKARLGGDEFVLIIKGEMEIDVLKRKVEEVLDMFKHRFEQYYQQYGLSISAGAMYLNNTQSTFEDIYNAVDKIMYQSKNEGKDRLVIVDDR